ncbi:GNAT family N-acetyltransferase [Rubritepida flocculans]|jgi:ribosomal protein S18 acetylase RimI-like enzyme|uniref:GNAT family N-acetyltransferase n=1 Tax=Rubritepida flocculans TaxID=182403 RepID=UPI00041B370B|nr:GNAT family N-acetyltransferase [Rubritepida flocculans]
MPRPARPDEAEAARALVRAAYAAWIPVIGREPGPMGDDYAARIAAGELWWDEGGQALCVLVAQPDALLLDNVAVAPAAQGRGLGRRLVAFAIEEARRRGLPAVTLYTHARMEANIALYARLGFRETHRAQEKGFERVYMRREVA